MLNASDDVVPVEVSENVPDAQLVGKGKMTYLFWDVYNAALFSPQGKYTSQPPYALSLTYLRDFDGGDIAKRSVKEIKDQGLKDKALLNTWEDQMQTLFPDVKEGMTLTGIHLRDGTTLFYSDNALLGTVSDTSFGDYFFGIWLKSSTSEPRLRAKLVGE